MNPSPSQLAEMLTMYLASLNAISKEITALLEFATDLRPEVSSERLKRILDIVETEVVEVRRSSVLTLSRADEEYNFTSGPAGKYLDAISDYEDLCLACLETGLDDPATPRDIHEEDAAKARARAKWRHDNPKPQPKPKFK